MRISVSDFTIRKNRKNDNYYVYLDGKRFFHEPFASKDCCKRVIAAYINEIRDMEYQKLSRNSQ